MTTVVDRVGDERLAETIESFGTQALATARDACAAAGRRSWGERVHAALGGLLELADAEPELSRLFLAEVKPRQHAAAAAHDDAIQRLTDLLARDAPSLGKASPQVTAEIVAGGVLVVLRHALTEEWPLSSDELLAHVSFIVLAPFVGSQEATRIAGSGCR